MPTTPPTNGDGSLRPYNADEVASFGLQWRGVRDGSTPTLSLEINANRAEATCQINPDKLNDFIYYAVGTSKVYTNGLGAKRLSRLLPFKLPGREGLVCTKITKINGLVFTGAKNSNGLPAYKKVEVSLLFETPKYVIKSDVDTNFEYERYVELLPGEISTDTIATFGSNLKFARDPAKPDPTAAPNGIPVPANSVYKTVPMGKFTTVQWRLPDNMANDESDLFALLNGTGEQDDVPYIGAINKEPMLGYPRGTLLLRGVRRHRDVSPIGDGSFEWRVEAEWESKLSGWNWIWFASATDPSVNEWYMVSSSGTFATAATVGDKDSLYAARDLRAVFSPPTS